MESEQQHQEELIRAHEEKRSHKSTKLTSNLLHAFVIGDIEFKPGETKVIEGKPSASLKKWIDIGVLKID